MRKNILYTLLLPLFISFSGCGDIQESVDSPYAVGTGGLNLKMKADTETSIPVITKSADFSGVSVNDFYVAILQENGSIYKEYKSYTQMVSEGFPLVLPIGTYTVLASSYKLEDTKKSNKPYFVGKDKLIIEEKKTSNATAICVFQSLGVELRLSDRFKALIEAEPDNYDYEVTVSNDEASYTFTKKEMQPVYFVKGCDHFLTVRVKVRLDSSNKWYPERVYWVKNDTGVEPTSPKLNEYYIINLDAGAEVENLSLRTTLVTADK